MRIVFLVALLGASIFYSYIAFVDLQFFNMRGRPGAGFFPRIIGVSMAVMTIWAILDALGDRRTVAAGGPPGEDDAPEGRWRDFVLLMAMAIGYAVLIRLFGGFVATIVFLGIALSLLNPGRHLSNGLVAVLFPVTVYLLFDLVLNASMPPALVELPF